MQDREGAKPVLLNIRLRTRVRFIFADGAFRRTPTRVGAEPAGHDSADRVQTRWATATSHQPAAAEAGGEGCAMSWTAAGQPPAPASTITEAPTSNGPVITAFQIIDDVDCSGAQASATGVVGDPQRADHGVQLRFICAATTAVGLRVGKHRANRSRRCSGRGSGVGLRTHDGEDPANQPAGGRSESGARVPIDPLAAADVSAERGVCGAADPTRRRSGIVHCWPSGGEPVSERSVRAVGSPNGAASVTKR